MRPYFLFILSWPAAGAATVFVSNPIFLVKTRMCIQDAKHPDAYKGLFGTRAPSAPAERS